MVKRPIASILVHSGVYILRNMDAPISKLVIQRVETKSRCVYKNTYHWLN